MLISGVLPAGRAKVSALVSYATVPAELLVSCQWFGSLKSSETIRGQLTGTSEICVGKPPGSVGIRVGVGVLGNQSTVGLGVSTWVGSGSVVGKACGVCPAQAANNKIDRASKQLNFGMFQFY